MYHKALVYCLGISEDTRKHARQIYNFETGCVNTECLTDGWIASGSAKIVRMAFNLYCNGAPRILPDSPVPGFDRVPRMCLCGRRIYEKEKKAQMKKEHETINRRNI